MIPMIKDSPSISKVSLHTQGDWMESGVIRAAAIFYICVSVILCLASPAIARSKNINHRIFVMGALFVNFCVASQVLSIIANSKA